MNNSYKRKLIPTKSDEEKNSDNSDISHEELQSAVKKVKTEITEDIDIQNDDNNNVCNIENDDEDDYLTMNFDDNGSIIERDEHKNIKKPNSQKKNLSNSLFENTNSKAYKMMQKMGFKPGQPLGPSSNNLKEDKLIEPISLDFKLDRSGVGAETAMKKKIKELEAEYKEKLLQNIDGYRKELIDEREQKRMESQILTSQRTLRNLDIEAAEKEFNNNQKDCSNINKSDPYVPITEIKCPSFKQISEVNLLWRGLEFDRLKKEAEIWRIKNIGNDLKDKEIPHQFMGYDELEPDDKIALGIDIKNDKHVTNCNPYEYINEYEDPELELLNNFSLADRLELILSFLRNKYSYCFWCRCQYESQEDMLQNCPGLTEKDHD